MACAKRFSRPPRYDRFDTSPCAKAILTQTKSIVNNNFIIFLKILLDITFQVWYIIQARKNAGVAQLVEQLICNQQVGGSSPSTSSISAKFNMGDFPSGQRGQTVNLLAMPSVVRIHHLPPKQKSIPLWCALLL